MCQLAGEISTYLYFSVMATVEEFLKTPSEELLELCSREQLVKRADHFELNVGDRWSKGNMKHILRENLFELGVLQSRPHVGAVVDAAGASASVVGSHSELTFEQRKELLLLQAGIKRLELEERRLSLQSGGSQTPVVSSGPWHSFDVAWNLRLVPPFCEWDPDMFFSLFEHVAESRGWSDAERTLLL